MATLAGPVLAAMVPLGETHERLLAVAGALLSTAWAATRLVASSVELTSEGFLPRLGAARVLWLDVDRVVATGRTYWIGTRDGRLLPLAWPQIGNGDDARDMIIAHTRHARRMVDTIHVERRRDATVFGVGIAIAVACVASSTGHPLGVAALLSSPVALSYGLLANGLWSLAWRRLLSRYVRDITPGEGG